MSTEQPRTLRTVTGAGGTSETYDLALDPRRSTLDRAVRVARLAEAARIDALFTADLLRFDAQGGIGTQEPLVFVSALSQVTSRIGLIATVSSTFHHPFNLARMFGTLDHVSKGRAAWNLVTSAVGEENFGPGGLPDPEERYARAAECLDVVNALWDGWEPDALGTGPDGRAVLRRDRVRPVHHRGRFFEVAGPLNIPPLPQGRPVQLQAGQSAAGRALGARYAEIVFTSLPTLETAVEFTRAIRAEARRLGRPEGLPLVFSSLHATYGATEAEARRAVRERREAIDFERGRAQVADMLGGGVDLSGLPLDARLPESLLPDLASVNGRRGRVEIFAGYARAGRTLRELVVAAQDTGHWAEAGTPEQIADAVEERFRAGVLDVVSLGDLGDPRQHDFIVDGVLHELRRRGIVAPDYTGTTLRENLGLPRPARVAPPARD
ncbi:MULTISPECIES: NtaA/DmoA family FMN-dependent monooxygenase [Streptomyces]|uniref:NtaA/DmoA family FMN-dependent monooxygenase n=1 Tax=Streptomyces doudnae TaxID=3075536 RepID=A0ABD5EVD1_9ACTN|nr:MULTISPECIES: NtaA/DmoA family FMN-dependent monooxygenase [unclassified Streptomyces]MDT0438319.1 NtaA/DmoA family FMN-dependent monooxygenase [Streptomyces sp. DSM 41981]MYQ68342.1 NtaA/DmoA family FMN-dependent monooxygenase [Streptomyces sp. SID4950]SCE45299.1 FMN-dependent oxidoreductase, nitrilotriacetate monooxygenase family [Streptomyces sp. SolWspMP-5a-2]